MQKTLVVGGKCSAKTITEQTRKNCDFARWGGTLGRGCMSGGPGGRCTCWEAVQASMKNESEEDIAFCDKAANL